MTNSPNGKFTIKHTEWRLLPCPPNRNQQCCVQDTDQNQQRKIDADEYDGRVLPTDEEALLEMQWKTCARIESIEERALTPKYYCEQIDPRTVSGWQMHISIGKILIQVPGTMAIKMPANQMVNMHKNTFCVVSFR